MAVETGTTEEIRREQAHIDRAYERLEALRDRAREVLEKTLTEAMTGTHQSRFNRDVMVYNRQRRLSGLDFGDEALVFGRVDTTEGDALHIGRVAVSDEEREPLVIDWRAPVAESFYRATGADPMGLRRRRHLICRGPKLMAIDDELLEASADGDDLVLVGEGALMAAVERSRTGRMRDIVATIQAEQDRVIRAPLEGVLVVQGGPGTGKTAVALHRAAYLLYTYREQLERAGVLLVGPSRIFLRYIERVLPSLGEEAVRLATPATMLEGIPVTSEDPPEAAILKGDARMAKVIGKVASAQRRGRVRPEALVAGLLSSREALQEAAQGVLTEEEISSIHRPKLNGFSDADIALIDEARARLPKQPELPAEDDGDAEAEMEFFIQQTLDEIGSLSDDPEVDSLMRAGLRHRLVESTEEATFEVPEREVFGYVIVDEGQDLSPMQWRMVSRRCPTQNMTIVGDLGQGSRPWSARSWDAALGHLKRKKRPQVLELTINYRTPAEIMAFAAPILAATAPELSPPQSVRESGEEPSLVPLDGDLASTVLEVVREERARVGDGKVAVIVPPEHLLEISEALSGEIEGGRADDILASPVVVLSPDDAKGLEFDSVVVVEPSEIAAGHPGGLRALYVALTRATQRLVLVYSGQLPPELKASS
jgi:DNA helicase IV